MKIIELTQGYKTKVDDDDYEKLKGYSWHTQLQQRGTVVTAARTSTISQDGVRGKCIYMHRVIMNCPDGMQVDHIDRDTLNNQKSNLRICSNSENQANQMIPHGTFRGIKKRKNGNYTARLIYETKQINLGTYKTPIEAAMRYDAAAVYCYREFAVINFPEFKEEYLKQAEKLDNQEKEKEDNAEC